MPFYPITTVLLPILTIYFWSWLLDLAGSSLAIFGYSVESSDFGLRSTFISDYLHYLHINIDAFGDFTGFCGCFSINSADIY